MVTPYKLANLYLKYCIAQGTPQATLYFIKTDKTPLLSVMLYLKAQSGVLIFQKETVSSLLAQYRPI